MFKIYFWIFAPKSDLKVIFFSESGKDCVIDGHKYSQDEVEATEAKVKSVIQRQRDAVRKKKDEAFRRQREERERRRET